MGSNPNRQEAARAAVAAVALAATVGAATHMLRSDPVSIPAGAPDPRSARSPLAEASELLANGEPESAKRAYDGAGARAEIRLATTIRGTLKWSRDGSRLASLTRDGLAVFSAGDFREVSRLDAEGVEQFVLSDDGRLAALFRSHGFTDPQATFEILRTDTGEVLGRIPNASQCTLAMAFSADGKLFAGSTTNADDLCGGAVIWDIDKRAVRHVVPSSDAGAGSRGRVSYVQLLPGGALPGGALLRTAELEGAERTWDVGSGALVASREGFLDVGPDGIGVYLRREQVTAHVPKLFDTRTSKELGELTSKECPAAKGTLFGPKGGSLATFGDDRLCLWDARAGSLLGTAPLDERPSLDQVHFTPNGKAVVVGRTVLVQERVERVRVYSAATAALVENLGSVIYLGQIGDALLFHDKHHRELVRVRGDQTSERTPFEVRAGKFVFPWYRREPSPSPEPWAWEPRSDSVEVGDGGLAVLDGATGELATVAAEPGKWEVQTSPDLHWMVGWDEHGHSRIWDLVRRRAVRAMFAAPGTPIEHLELTKEGLKMSSGKTEHRLDLSTGTLQASTLAEEPKQDDSGKPAPLYVEVQALGRTVRLKPVPNPTFVLHSAFQVPPGQSRVRLSVTALAVSRDERTAAASFALGDGVVDDVWSGEVRVFELPSGRQTRRYQVPYWVYILQFDADGRRLLATGYNDPVGAWVWDVRTGKQLLEIPGVNTASATLSERGDRLTLVTEGDGHLEVWDVDRATRLLGPVPKVKDVATSEDGNLVAAIGPGTIRLFGLDGAPARTVPDLRLARPVDGATFVGELLAVWGGDVLELRRTTDGTTAMSLRFGSDSALALSDGKVELFGDEAKARLLARCHADGHDFPLEWCERGRVERGMLAKLLSPRRGASHP